MIHTLWVLGNTLYLHFIVTLSLSILGGVIHGLVLDEVGDVEVARDAVVLRRGSPFDVGNSSEGKSSLW